MPCPDRQLRRDQDIASACIKLMQACEDVEIPVKDSPETPKTPDIPSDISRSVKTSDSKRFLLDPQSVLRTEGFSGYWRTKKNHGPHRDVKAFKPASAEEAKAFLSQISLQLQPKLLVFSSETPRSSRTVKLRGRSGDMPCHGCHGPLGGGAHNGSAPGKDICTLPHHPSCPGGVVEDKDYRACIHGYVHQPQLVPETGFDQTLSSQDFLATQSQSTTLLSGPGTDVHYSQGMSGHDMTHLVSHHTPTVMPGLSQSSHIITENMQGQMDAHRAMNQAQSENQDRPLADGLTINNLRASPSQQAVVGDQMAGFREVIPALFAAPTAKVPQPPPLPGTVGGLHHGVQHVQISSTAQLHTQSIVSGSSHSAQQSQLSQALPVFSQPILDPFGGARQRVQNGSVQAESFVPQATPLISPSQSYHGVSYSSQASAGGGPPQPTYGAIGGVSHGGQQHSNQAPQILRASPAGAASTSTLANGQVTWTAPHANQQGPRLASHAGGFGTQSAPQTYQQGPHLASQAGAGGGIAWSAPHTSQQVPRMTSQIGPHVGHAQNGYQFHSAPQTSQHVPQHAPHRVPAAGQQIPHPSSQSGLQQLSNHAQYTVPHQSSHQVPRVAPGMVPPQQNPQFTDQQHHVPPQWQQQQQFPNGQQQPQLHRELQQAQSFPGQSSSLPQEYSGQSAAFNSQASYQTPHGPSNYFNSGVASMNDHQIPVMKAPPVGAQSFTPVYDFFVDTNGQTCKVLRQPQFTPPTRTEFRCSPRTGRMFKVQVPVKPMSPPPAKKYEWRCNALTGERWQVEVPVQQQSPQMSGPLQQVSAQGAGQLQQQQLAPVFGQPQQPQSSPWSGHPQPGVAHQSMFPQPDVYPQQQLRHRQQGDEGQQQLHSPGDFNQQLQNKVKGIVKLYEGGVTKKAAKLIDYAKKGSAKWAKKETSESINLPLFTFGAISELESSLSGRTEPLPEGVFLAKLRHIKNFLDVCCLNSEPTDFKGYGWTIAKDYALKVEGEVEQQHVNWEEMPAGVQTSQLLLAQMNCPKPAKSAPKGGLVNNKQEDKPVAKARCTTYNTCKTEDKCEYELSHPDKKCILKHECNWCKTNTKQSWKHQEWNCKRKN